MAPTRNGIVLLGHRNAVAGSGGAGSRAVSHLRRNLRPLLRIRASCVIEFVHGCDVLLRLRLRRDGARRFQRLLSSYSRNSP